MAKRDLASVSTDLAALANPLPTQRPAPAPSQPAAPQRHAQPLKREKVKATQFSMSLTERQRKQLFRLAHDADMTMRAFVLHSLKVQGLTTVDDDDLVDMRRRD